MHKAFVYIVESPSDIDLLDGRTEGRTLCEALKLTGVDHEYSLATTITSFRYALKERLGFVASHFPDKTPILHLSMHGNVNGLGLTDGTFLSWADLRRELNPLVESLSGDILLCMSACKGASGIRMAMFDGEGHTFGAIVGNYGDASWSDLAVGYTSFYHLLFKGIPLAECVERIKAASGHKAFCYFLGRDVKHGWEQRWAIANQLRADAPLLSWNPSTGNAPPSSGPIDLGPGLMQPNPGAAPAE
jgi:hypothetical protein